MAFRYLVPITLVIALAGCSVGVPWNRDRPLAQQQPVPLPPPANTGVQTATLPPLDGTQTYPPTVGGTTAATTDGLTGEPLAPPNGTQTAMTAPASGAAIGRTDLLGGWTITSAGDSCQLFMTLTSWTGGYRASTRGCTTDALKSISAWNLQGTSVVLAGQGGSPVATLASTGPNRFDGQAGAQPVSFYR